LARLLGGPVVPAARGLLGCLLTGGGVTVRLTEVEAYSGLGQDPASHAHRGPTRRNTVMFGPAGYTYVYFTYGMHWCANVVCGPVGQASAVLLRAGSIVDGIELARSRRGPSIVDHELARGPARLTVALGVDGTATGTCMLSGEGPLMLSPRPSKVDPALIRSGPRVGISLAADLPWRFWLDGERSVSAYRPGTRRRP
jgi:DNA-3-methyladenine glycosylase